LAQLEVNFASGADVIISAPFYADGVDLSRLCACSPKVQSRDFAKGQFFGGSCKGIDHFI
jgi:hypothetical protein